MRVQSRARLPASLLAATAIALLVPSIGTAAASELVLPIGSSLDADAEVLSGCESPDSYQAFSRFGDDGWYYLAPGGDFEGPLSWSTSGWVARMPLSDPFNLTGVRGRGSVLLRSGGRMTSPKLCVTSDISHLRFVGGTLPNSDELDVRVRVYAPDGEVSDSASTTVVAGNHLGWRPSPKVGLRTEGLLPGEAGYVDVSFRSEGAWLVDDVFLDPYRKG